MTTYIIKNDSPKYDRVLKKIQTTAKQTKVKVVEMTDMVIPLWRETRENEFDKLHDRYILTGKEIVTLIIVA